ncbi:MULTISPECIES: FadR/GntR family transcriptional regulator [Mesobacillus]|uniref:FadR/GntR family transcriptional regulator n=1 Tax=Mesobacillus TaxID=2675231 RepID=UPI001783632D|nr:MULTISPECIES: FadR/GntR family transcriptional regulator [Mesobacillus]MCM3575423.1 FadR family transcriptional regulator [Mesobacillus subterraneus]UYZ22381.1 FadR family transcriptional regulator [Mesobacillus jeotgali]
MPYKRVKVKKVYEQVADSIIELIKTGELKPGDKLDSVEKLAKSFDVGSSTIREALSGLRTMGLVTMRQGEGTFVNTFDPSKFQLPVTSAFLMKLEDVKELYEVRKILESGTAAHAAAVHQEEDLIAMEKALIVMEHANGNEDLASTADLDFHVAIANATHNKLLINLMSSVSALNSQTIQETRKVLLYSENIVDDLQSEHRRIFEAIKNRQPDEARQAMLEHLQNVQDRLFKYIE